MPQAKFANGESIGRVKDWILAHNSDYGQVRARLDTLRNVVLRGRIDAASRVLKRSYLFAVMSIQTERDRHERAFTAYHAGNASLKDACLQTVYGGQKFGWVDKTFQSTDFELLAIAVRRHIENGRQDTLLDVVVENLTGVSYRKGAFMLAMAGLYEYLCIDSNVGRYADIDGRRDFDSAEEYMDTCNEIVQSVDVSPYMPPFIVQWAIYDFERGEHARHMAYFQEVLY